MTGIDYIDSSGALFIIKLEDEARARNVPFSIHGLSKEKMGILSLIDRQALTAPSLAAKERTLNIIEQLGNASIDSRTGHLRYHILFGGTGLRTHPFIDAYAQGALGRCRFLHEKGRR